jgi:futalosine hydrolase
MSFKVLFVAATASEAASLNKISGMDARQGGYRYGRLDISLLVTGVGSVSTAWAMKQWISVNDKPDLAINGGIAGSYNPGIIAGDVVMPVSDCFADAGVEDGDTFLTLPEAGLSNANEFPYSNGQILGDKVYIDRMKDLVKPVRAITVNTATGSATTRNKLIKKFNPDIETMEGATFFYICVRENIPFLALRAISNMVEPRNKSTWKIELALDKLSEMVDRILLTLE